MPASNGIIPSSITMTNRRRSLTLLLTTSGATSRIHATGDATRSGTSTALNATIGCGLPSSRSVKLAARIPRTGRLAPSSTVASI